MFIAILGERESIVVSSSYGGVFSADPCMQAQFLAGHTADSTCNGTSFLFCVLRLRVVFGRYPFHFSLSFSFFNLLAFF
jgi:hypothetical protein